MERDIEHNLEEWKNQTKGKPLLLRGARQVGKTFIIRQFGWRHFENVVEINFELSPKYKRCFESLEPNDILNLIRGISGKTITPGKTLLFLDEIQDCPRAIMAMRYFKELMPGLHVIGAGSLLEFALKSEDFRMPVGRVQFLYQKPISYSGFLRELDYTTLREQIEKASLELPLPDVLHEQALQLVKEYLIVGGMPESVDKYLETKDFSECQNIQSAILATYRSDFSKYAKGVQHKYLQAVFDKVPFLAAKYFKYVKVDREMYSRNIKEAIALLSDAGFLNQVFATSAGGLPLSALVDHAQFKLIMVDVGLMTQSSGLTAEILLADDVLRVNDGAVAEQFVGQELLAYKKRSEASKLFFWKREKPGSSAEIDYIINIATQILPVEVKSGATGRLKSLQLFMENHNAPLGVRISQRPLTLEGNTISIPFYMISQIPRLVDEYRSKLI